MSQALSLDITEAASDADLQVFLDVRRAVLPDDNSGTVASMRAAEGPDRHVVLARVDGQVVGSGLADRSHIADGFVAPRILPAYRRRGYGTAVLRYLLENVRARGYRTVSSLVEDEGSYTFAVLQGFAEVDRQVEQVRQLHPSGPETEPPPVEGVTFTTIEERPELLEAAYPLAQQGYADMVLTTGPANVPLDEWLRDEATLPAGSMVALAGDQIVGYAGLIAWEDDPTKAENGLTVVARDWRRQGLALALKRRQLAWASRAGLRELITWTQLGNEAMQEANRQLGYVDRSVARTMRLELT
jgi:GNAT superfamily N-acetyltransferase